MPNLGREFDHCPGSGYILVKGKWRKSCWPVRTLKQRFDEKWMPEPNSGCWLWMGGWSSTGYGQINVDGTIRDAHRVSWELYRGPIPEGLRVLHRCDVHPCVNPDHLFLGTQQDNLRDMLRKGRHPNAKLTAADIERIISSPLSGHELARRMGLDPSTVNKIRRGDYAERP